MAEIQTSDYINRAASLSGDIILLPATQTQNGCVVPGNNSVVLGSS